MGLIRMGPPEGLILALKANAGWNHFVETGTFHGDTAEWAFGHFERVTTIELSEKYHAAACERFAGRPGVRVLKGSSTGVLCEIVPTLAGPAIFWLDAHWSGLDTAGRESECPLLDEIAIINSCGATHTILVDDARLFSAPPPLPHNASHWPGLVETTAALNNEGSRHVVQLDDVFVAVPVGLKERLVSWIQSDFKAPTRKSAFRRLKERIGL